MKYPIDELVERLEKVANPDDAPAMKKYMKDRYEYLGVKSPPRKEVLRDFVKKHGLPDRSSLDQAIKDAWQCGYREAVYCMTEVMDRTKKVWDPEIIDLLEWMIVNESWWDSVDGIASKLVGSYFKKYPENKGKITSRWIESDDMWLRRTALIFQLKYKSDTDTDMLADYIERTAHEKEFFIRKAIGWILREYSKTNPQWVADFIDSHDLQPLSVREGSKYL